MKKIIIIFTVLVLGGSAYLIIKNNKPNKQSSPLMQNTQTSPTPLAVSQNTQKYLDQETGFSFAYPDNLTATKSEDLKDTVYADLKITGKILGSIRFFAEDTTAKTVAEYLTKNKLSTTGAQVSDVKLADLPATKYAFADKAWVFLLDQNVIYWLNADYKNEPGFWSTALDKITTSFAFEKVADSGNSGASSNEGDVVDEGEEIVE